MREMNQSVKRNGKVWYPIKYVGGRYAVSGKREIEELLREFKKDKHYSRYHYRIFPCYQQWASSHRENNKTISHCGHYKNYQLFSDKRLIIGKLQLWG